MLDVLRKSSASAAQTGSATVLGALVGKALRTALRTTATLGLALGLLVGCNEDSGKSADNPTPTPTASGDGLNSPAGPAFPSIEALAAALNCSPLEPPPAEVDGVPWHACTAFLDGTYDIGVWWSDDGFGAGTADQLRSEGHAFIADGPNWIIECADGEAACVAEVEHAIAAATVTTEPDTQRTQ